MSPVIFKQPNLINLLKTIKIFPDQIAKLIASSRPGQDFRDPETLKRTVDVLGNPDLVRGIFEEAFTPEYKSYGYNRSRYSDLKG